ncbi:MAG: hypothetical protein RIQ54_431 [Candidatus Parcubacteria bacterium]|jgi:hypothetical protein
MKFIKEKIIYTPTSNQLLLGDLLKRANVQIGLWNPVGLFGDERTIAVNRCKETIQRLLDGESYQVDARDVFWGRPKDTTRLPSIDDFADAAAKLSYRVCGLRHVLSAIGAHWECAKNKTIWNGEKRICCVPLPHPLPATYLVAVIVNDYEKNRSNPHRITVVSQSEWNSLRIQECLRFLYERLH